MKLHTVVGLLSLTCLGVYGCEEKAAPEQPAAEAPKPAAEAEKPAAEPEKAAEAEKPAEPGPADACGKLVEAAKAHEAEKFNAMVEGADALTATPGVHAAVLTTIGSGTCGEAKVEEGGEKATVALQMGEGKEAKELPFVKTAEGWKLDGAAYLAKNPVEVAKAKKGKRGKKKRRK